MTTHGFTLAHVTHEAVEHLGGIGTVLEGLMTSPVYQRHVRRSILVGPTQARLQNDPEARLGSEGTVLYSSIDGIDRADLAGRFRPIEWAFNVAIVYGRRRYMVPGDASRTGEAEVLLIDVFQTNHDRLNVFKARLWETFGFDAARYEKSWDFEEYARIAEPAFYTLVSLLNDDELPCVLISHEFMGMPTALQAILDGNERFRTVFHAHECATARHLVENHPGHDTMYYNVMDRARARGLYAGDVFGDLDHLFRHALVRRSHLCDGVIAVGDRTRDELQFLDPHFDDQPIDLVYNGLPAGPVDLASKLASRRMLMEYGRALLETEREPDVLMTHVTRPVISKGMWRDMKVCHALDAQLADRGLTGLLIVLTTAAGVRRTSDVVAMEHSYGWPRHHRHGYPDLVGPEVQLYQDIEGFNQYHTAIQIVLVNQFGWSTSRIGRRLPETMSIADLRRATDVEFGMATYEPFGISPLEPLGAGAICVISSVCGCEGLVEHVTNGEGAHNVISADFTRLPDGFDGHDLDGLQQMSQQDRDGIEQLEADRVAAELMRRLPENDAARQALIESGQALVSRMGWDQCIEEGLVPLLERIASDAKRAVA
ncbi:MAG: hypothetical protein CMJ18_27455 [Phycisphaeraceae bacterium]|nr:hypothetical protein [Phycisphaeraceae bacterium]